MRDVYPDGDLVARLADAAATCSSMTLFTMAPAIAVGFAASAELLSVFCQDCPVLAAHHDSDVLLHCFAAGNDTSSVQSLASKTGGYERPLRSYQPGQQLDIETLERCCCARPSPQTASVARIAIHGRRATLLAQRPRKLARGCEGRCSRHLVRLRFGSRPVLPPSGVSQLRMLHASLLCELGVAIFRRLGAFRWRRCVQKRNFKEFHN